MQVQNSDSVPAPQVKDARQVSFNLIKQASTKEQLQSNSHDFHCMLPTPPSPHIPSLPPSQTYTFPLALFGLFSLYAKNARAAMWTSLLLLFTLLLDIIFLGVWTRTRPPAGIVFLVFALLAKGLAAWQMHFTMRAMGGNYSWEEHTVVNAMPDSGYAEGGAYYPVASPSSAAGAVAVGLEDPKRGADAATVPAGGASAPVAFSAYQSSD